MEKQAGRTSRKQGPESIAQEVMKLILPITTAIASTKTGLMDLVHRLGFAALDELLEVDAEQVTGKKGARRAERTHNRWGTTRGALTFGGRRVQVTRPRVRSTVDGEVGLPMWELLSEVDPMPERVMQQAVLGVSTRRYADSLEELPDGIRTRGTSKSEVSRKLVGKTKGRLREFLGRRLEDRSFVAIFIDGIEVAGASVVIALGVELDGTKVPLGLWQGSTENSALCISLLHDLVTRGLALDGRMLFVIDGGKGLRKALTDVFGDAAVVQRCQVHKRRNVKEHVSVARRAYVQRQMNVAYRSQSAKVARGRLKQLASWLENNGEPDAAASVREGLEETLTVHKLGLSQTLRKTLATTNPIENMNGTIRRVSRNVKRWHPGPSQMIKRWVALGVVEAQGRFRRIKGHKDLAKLCDILRAQGPAVDQAEQLA